MVNLEEIKKKRFQFVHQLYEISGGNRYKRVLMWNIGEKLGFSHEETENIGHYLNEEGLIEYVLTGPQIAITHDGVVEVEKALSSPEEPTEHFVPIVNIINVQHMEGSQIQQGTVNSTQTGNFTVEFQENLSGFITLLREKLPELKVQEEDKSELEADIATVELQLSSSRPKSNIIKECLSSIKRVLEGVTESVVVSGLLKYLPAIIASL